MNSPALSGVTRISGNLIAPKMLFNSTRIHSKSPALKPLWWEQRSLAT